MGAEPAPRFVGRTNELERLGALVASGHRLVTIWGAGGMGKTRIARELARSIGRPVVEVDLTEVIDVEGLAAGVARAVGVQVSPARREEDVLRQVARALRARGRVVVVLDGFEHLVESSAHVVELFAREASQAQLLVTSRERLRLESESAFELGPLALSGTSEAASLFVARAEDAGLHVDGADPRVATLLAGLEGIPLAIELAAARLEVLGLDGLLDRLDARLSLLSRGVRGARAKHATMRGAIAWSWDLLSEAERQTLIECAIFRGGFTMAAAEKVLSVEPAYARIDLVTALRDKSLLYVKPETGGAPRLALYETVREFAMEKLVESPTASSTLARHDAYFLEVGARLSMRVDETGDIHARELLARDYDNLMEVHARSVAHASADPHAARVAASALLAADAVMSTQASAEVRARLWEGTWAVVRDAPLSAALLVRAQGALGRALAARGDHEAAIVTLRAAVAEAQAAGEVGLEPSLWVDLGVALHAKRDLEGARAAYLAAVSADRKMTDPRSRARALGNLGALDHDEQKPAAARKSYERSVELASGVSDPRIEGIMLTNLAVLDQEEGALGVASTRYERALRLLEQAQDLRLLAIAWGNFGMLLAEKGDTASARSAEERAVGLSGAIGDHRSLGLAHARLAAMSALAGDRARATTHVAESRAAFQSATDEIGLDIARVAEAFLEIGGGPAAHERARLLLADAPKCSDDVRALSRLLERALAPPTVQAPVQAPLAPDALGVGPRFASYRPPRGGVVSIEDHRAAHQIFARLVEWRRDRPGEGLDTASLTDAGWPGEKMRLEAARNRLYVVIAWLRKNGLDGILLRRPQGYLLDPEVPIDLRERLGRV